VPVATQRALNILQQYWMCFLLDVSDPRLYNESVFLAVRSTEPRENTTKCNGKRELSQLSEEDAHGNFVVEEELEVSL
jgi:hypothetical protein